MKSNAHYNINLVEFYCISCEEKYEAYSTNLENPLKMDVCANCHAFYTGKSFSDVKTGKIEAFNKRERKAIKLKKVIN